MSLENPSNDFYYLLQSELTQLIQIIMIIFVLLH